MFMITWASADAAQATSPAQRHAESESGLIWCRFSLTICLGVLFHKNLQQRKYKDDKQRQKQSRIYKYAQYVSEMKRAVFTEQCKVHSMQCFS